MLAEFLKTHELGICKVVGAALGPLGGMLLSELLVAILYVNAAPFEQQSNSTETWVNSIFALAGACSVAGFAKQRFQTMLLLSRLFGAAFVADCAAWGVLNDYLSRDPHYYMRGVAEDPRILTIQMLQWMSLLATLSCAAVCYLLFRKAKRKGELVYFGALRSKVSRVFSLVGAAIISIYLVQFPIVGWIAIAALFYYIYRLVGAGSPAGVNGESVFGEEAVCVADPVAVPDSPDMRWFDDPDVRMFSGLGKTGFGASNGSAALARCSPSPAPEPSKRPSTAPPRAAMPVSRWTLRRKLLLTSSVVSLAIAACLLGGLALTIRARQRRANSPYSEVNEYPGVLPAVGIHNKFSAFKSDPKNASPQTLEDATNSDEALLNAALAATKSSVVEESPLPDDFLVQEPYEKGWSERKAIVLGRSSTGEVTFLLNGPAATQYYEHLYEANITCRDCDILVWKQLGTKFKLVLQAQADRAGDHLAFEPTSTNGAQDIVLRTGQTENMSVLSIYKYNGERYEAFACFQEGSIPNRYDMIPPYQGVCSWPH